MNSSAALCKSDVVQGHTYTEGSSRCMRVRKAAKIKTSPHSSVFHLPPTCSSKTLDYLETSSHWSAVAVIRNESTAQSPPFPPPRLKCVLFVFSLGCHAQPSVQLPPASGEAANLSPHPTWPQQMSLGGHQGREGSNRQRLMGSGEERGGISALVVIMFWLTVDKLCEKLARQVQVWYFGTYGPERSMFTG